MNHHDLVAAFKGIIYRNGEGYLFNNKKLLFTAGSRPVRRKYINSESDVVRNDVLQINYFEQNFKPDNVLWDIGAHNGIYSIFAASVAKGNDQVFSFEPDNVAREIQLKNIRLNKMQNRITVFDMAVSDHNGTLHFQALGGNANSHIIKDENYSDSNTIEVKTKTLDTLAQELPLPTYVKIDTEGAEIDILRAGEILLRNKDITFICELHPFAWNSFNVTYNDFLEILKKYDRQVKLLDPRKKLEDLPYYGTVIF
ncbi:FkbM family methyltransferase [Longitalea arenae]|uniref:FkbM family methyltransferase n=1 Tax=Longitalea arenae TaxID=2812558 RepID=UPI001967154F|nr:FkbM family methyltransferase [Longitalea arenae]